jgi:flavodoxin I
MFRFDESDPRYLIAYEESHEHSVAPYQALMQRWIARFERGDAFGVVLVNAPEAHDDHEHEDTHERDVAFEEAFTRLLNDFRRDHKNDVERCTVGFVRVLSPRWLDEQIAANPNIMNEMNANWDRTSRYMWGVPGMMCADVAEARAWLDEQIAAFTPPAEPVAELAEPVQLSSKRVGLFYGSTTGVTESIADMIERDWQQVTTTPLTVKNVGNVIDLKTLLEYDFLIIGIPTWNVGQLQDDWDLVFTQLDELDFTGKQVAMFGVGDQYGYPDNFQDAMGILGLKLRERGATLRGFWSTENYEFIESKAIEGNHFIGLALDEDNQGKLTLDRIHRWVAQIIAEFALLPVAHPES